MAGWLGQKIVGGGERISHGIPTYAISQALQRVPGSVSWGVFDSVSHGWDSALSEESQPVRHMIRVRSSGRGASSRVSGVYGSARLHVALRTAASCRGCARLNRFHKIAADAMFELDGTFDKAVGDQAMAFFGVPFRPEDHAQRAVTAALWIVKTLEDMIDDDESLRVGGGVGNGEAFIGNVAEGEVQDFTVIGDIVNTAARLQSLAEPGEVVIMEETHRWLTGK